MKVKEELKIVEKLINTYTAEDGKEFDNQKACEEYENKLVYLQLEQKAMSIKHIDFMPPYADDSHTYIWYYVTNKEEQKAVEDYYNHDASCELEFDIESFPEWIGVEEGYDKDCWQLGTLKQYKQSVDNMVEYLWKGNI